MEYSLKTKLFTFYDVVIDYVYPSICTGCTKKNTSFCNDCISSIKMPSTSPYDFIYPLFSYKDTIIRKAIWDFKLEGKRRLVKPLSSLLYDSMLEILANEISINNFTKPILISIPGSKIHNKRRGYDQGKLLCSELARLDNNNFFTYQENVIIRNNSSKPQTNISNKYKRIKNIKGVFSISSNNTKNVSNKNIILIDDVTTTGATLKEIHRILKKAGAKEILAFTLAH